MHWQALVLEALEAMRPEAEANSLQLVVDCDGEESTCLGDPERLRQVVTNLLANALKFTPAGGRVSVQVGGLDGSARLVVSDTGSGIDLAFLPHVFERFAQEKGKRQPRPRPRPGARP